MLVQGGVQVLRRAGRMAQLRLRGDGRRACRRRPACRSRSCSSPPIFRMAGSPRATRPCLPAPPDRRRRRALALLHVGHHCGAQGREALRRRADRRRHGPRLRARGRSRDDVGSIAFPCTHIGGPDYLVVMLAYGMPAVLLETFDPASAVTTFSRHGVTMAGGSTAFYLAFLNEQRKDPSKPVIPSLRLLNGGGAPKPPEVFREVRAEMHIPVCHGYGMTECPMITQGSHQRHRRAARQHRRRAGVRVRGADRRRGRHSRYRPGVTGEVRVRGPMLAKGYTDPELSSAVVRRRRLLPHRRPRLPARRRPHRAHRAQQGDDHPQGREHQPARDRGPACRPIRRWPRSR